MNFAALFKVAVLLVSTDVVRSQWTACSQTCGPGTRYRKCSAADSPKCRIRYEDCTLKDCPSVKCCDKETWRYQTTSECCKKVDSESCGVVQIKKVSRRVVGGQVSVDGQWPWMAALWQKKIPQVYICGGALVNKRWVVTAAHCLVDLQLTAKDVVVKIGMRVKKGENPHLQPSDILEFIPYPSYRGWKDDIALIKLKKTIQYTTHVHPVCMPSSEQLQPDTICYVAGWGYASNAAAETSNELRQADLRVLPLDACKDAYSDGEWYVGVTENVTCAGHHAGGKDSCGGDSGSPLVCQRQTSCQWYLAGVVAFGAKECGRRNTPGVYTNVQKYEDWIMDQISSHPCKSFPCKNDGTCIRLPKDEYFCRCKHPYVGTNCERRLCQPNPCRNKGKCSIIFQGIRYISKCTCPPGYTGHRCEISICTPNPCRNGGKCSITPQGTAKCTCTIAYKGERCQTGVCVPNPCKNKGKCSVTPQGTAKCTCPSGYEGNRCQTSTCTPNPCRNGGKCSITPQGTTKCTCTIAYKGERCQTGVCVPNPCENKGKCSVTPQGTAKCTCPSGYEGNRCQTSPCLPNPCENKGSCFVTSSGTARCRCPPRHTGYRCEAKIVLCRLCEYRGNGGWCSLTKQNVECPCRDHLSMPVFITFPFISAIKHCNMTVEDFKWLNIPFIPKDFFELR